MSGENIKERKVLQTLKPLLISTLVLGLLILGFAYSTRVKLYQSFDSYLKADGHVFTEQPATAYDYICLRRHVGILAGIDAYSFKLDDDEYQKFIESIIEKYNLLSDDYSNLKYGYAHYYGIKVSEINVLNNAENPGYTLNDFTSGKFLNHISQKPVEDYIVILYDPQGIGSVYCGIFADPDTKRIICYRGGTIK